MESTVITINEVKLPVKELAGNRVVTLKEIDLVHGRPEGTARKRFNDNKKHFILGEDYIVRNSDEAKTEYGIKAPNGLVLITESGYLMIVKSFTDDKAWKVQRDLVNSYFKLREVSYNLSEELPVNTQALNQVISQLTNSFKTIVDQMDSRYELMFEEFKSIIEKMAQKSAPVIKDKVKDNPLIATDPIRDSIKPLAKLYNDKSVGYNNTYRKVYAAMEVDWKYRQSRYRNKQGNKNKPSKFYLLESDTKLFSMFTNTVKQLIAEATEVNKL
jgi:hypothetical protein